MKKFLLGTMLMLASFTASAGSVSITNPTSAGSGVLSLVTVPSVQYTFGSEFAAGESVALSWDTQLTGASLGLVDFSVASTLINWSLSIFDGLNETVLTSGNPANVRVSSLFSMTGDTVYNLLMTGTSAITSFAVGFSYPPDVSEVPLPAAAWLFGSVLFGGLALRRRSRKTTLQAVVA